MSFAFCRKWLKIVKYEIMINKLWNVRVDGFMCRGFDLKCFSRIIKNLNWSSHLSETFYQLQE